MSSAKRMRSTSTNSGESISRSRSWTRRRSRSPPRSSRRSKDGNRSRQRSSNNSNKSCSKVRRGERHPQSSSSIHSDERVRPRVEERPSISHRSEGDTDVNTRLDRLECLLQTFMKRSSNKTDDKVVRCNIRSDCIPEFHPGLPNLSAEKWLEKIEQLSEINCWDDNTKIYFMQNRLSGLAKTWYSNLSSYDRTWSEWKDLIRKSFPEHHDFASSLRKLVNRIKHPNESMTEYYFAKMNLIQACKISGKDAVSCLIDGLQDSTIQTGAKAGRYNSPEELYSEFLSSINVTEKRHLGYSRHNEKKIFNKQRSGETQPYTRKEGKSENNKTVKCFNCNEKGHVSTKCDKPKIECKNCNRLGHDSNNCMKLRATVKYVNNQSAQKNDCYYVECKINGKCVRGFIDTGCSAVILRHDIAKELDLKIEPCVLKINGYGGGSASVVGKVTVELEVDLAKATIEVLVVPNKLQEIPLLVGQTFLNNEIVSFNVRDNTVRVFNKDEVILPEIESLPPTKVAVWAANARVIPPNSVGFIECESEFEGDIYVENSYRSIPDAEHWICGGVLRSRGGYVAIANVSNSSISVKKERIVARGMICEEDKKTPTVSTLTANIEKLEPFSLKDIENQVEEGADINVKNKLINLLNRYRHCFAQNLSELGKTNTCEIKINLHDSKPIVFKPYRMAFSEREVVRSMIDELLENNIIRESTSPFSSPILLVKKKTGEYRMCVDYRRLNTQTIKDAYPIPRIDDQVERIKGCKYFTTLDLASGYYQIPINEESIPKTAFITPDGHYEYLRMPFGLANAPAVFQRTINTVLGQLRFTTALAYMDDILVPSEEIEKGLTALEQVLQRLAKANLTLRLQKCFFFKTKIEYLGYEVSSAGIKPGIRKITAVSKFPRPCNMHQVRQFLGLASYFRKFINNFATLAAPLTYLLKKNVVFEWNQEEEHAFNELKSKLSQRPLLTLYDHKARTELHTDASKVGIASVLLQEQDDKNIKPIAYYSRATTKEEKMYHSYELETLAVVCSLKHFRSYLIGKEFKVITDCSAVRSSLTKRDLIPRIGRWWLTIQEYDFSVEYRPGARMAHVDALSRNPTIEDQILTVDITTDDWVLTAQLRDDGCRHLIDILSKKSNNEYEKRIHKEYSIKDNRLYRNTENGKKWVVPKASRREIVMCHHDNVGHFSLEKTLEYISKKYWFSSMKKYVKNYIDRCLACIYNKVPAGKSPGYLNIIEKISVPMHTLHVDHLGPFVKSSRGNTHLLLIIDGFTKFVFMKPVSSTKVGPVIKTFDEIIDTFGVPNRIICDRGSCFTSEKFTEYCKQLGIKRILNATATPRANGQAERYNRTILSCIATSNEDETKWDKTVSSIRWGLNITINKTTGKSPYEMLLGYVPRSANDSFLSNEVCEDVHENLKELRVQASASTARQQDSQKHYFDKKRWQGNAYKVGQYVVVNRPKGSNEGKSRKLMPKYGGPYVIKKVLNHDRYVIEDLPGSKRSRKKYSGIWSGDKLKLYNTQNDDEEDTD